MVIRVLAGAVPMICGALIFTGIIPVREWVFGSVGASPADMIRSIKAADRFTSEGVGTDNAEVSDAATRARAAGLNPEQVQAALREARQRQAALRRNGMSTPDAQHAGWAPSGGGWQR